MSVSSKKYDVVIIGGGPAGLTAGIYTARARLSGLLVERGAVGGQILYTERVENYPGFSEGVGSLELMKAMREQAEKFGLEIRIAGVTGIKISAGEKTVETSEGSYTTRAVIIAGGLERQKLGVPGEAEYTGRGVSYCATCDGAFFRDRPVAVVGGGNTAITEALELTKFASDITVIHRRDELRATRILQEKAFAEPKLRVLWDSAVDEITGGTAVEKVGVSNVKTGEKSALTVAGVFMAVGFKANTEYLQGVIKLDENNAVITDDKMATNVPGIFAAGDIRSGSVRQVIAAAGDGAGAAINAEKYIAGLQEF